jgi:hypothetical protein
MLWGYIVIDTNKILTIKCYLWLSSSANICTKIVKEQICFEQTRSKTMVAKYPKNLFKPAMRDLQTKEKTREGRVGVGNRKWNGEEEGADLLSPLRSVFARVKSRASF